MKVDQKKLIYLYCITRTKPPYNNFKEIGVKIYPVYFQGIYAIVSKVSQDEFSEENFRKNLASFEWVEKKARQHENVIQEVMRHTTVIPFKFGTIFENEENVERLLKEHISEFKRIIDNLEGKEERGIKIYCNLEKFKNILHKKDENIKKIDGEISIASKGKAFFLKKKREGVIEDIITKRISEYTQDAFEKLRKKSAEARINKILSKEVTEKNEDMVLNTAFLMKKKQKKDFDKVLEHLKQKYSNKGLSFECTGPWPPYNFCALSEKE